MKGFPLPGFMRQVAEGHKAEAQEYLDKAKEDMRSLLNGGERSGVFKPTSDPVDILVAAARQFELCNTVLKMDDEAREDS